MWDGRTTLETRYFISSLTNDAELFSQLVRGHWNIENQLNWVLAIAFNYYVRLNTNY